MDEGSISSGCSEPSLLSKLPSPSASASENLGLNNPKVGISIEIVDQDMCRLVETNFSFDIKNKNTAFGCDSVKKVANFKTVTRLVQRSKSCLQTIAKISLVIL